MLESALEQLLVQSLTPYVDGIALDSLHLGVFSGSLELRDLRVKQDALALLGLEGVRVRSGTIRLVKLVVPWSKLHTGKLRALVQAVHLEVELLGESANGATKEAELVAELREMRRRAIDLRVTQLRDLLEQQREPDAAAAAAGNPASLYGVRLLRKVLNNIHVDFSDLRVAFASEQRGIALGLELPLLAAVSTDQTFRERPDTQEVSVSSGSMYKLLRLQGLGLSMSAAGSSSLVGAEYVLSPMTACLKLAHVPSDQILRLRLEVGTEEVAEVHVLRSQVQHLRKVQAAWAEEAARLQALLVPPDEERRIQADPAASQSEYGSLYERHLVWEWRMAGAEHKPLGKAEVRRMHLLEDALSARLIARQRWQVQRKLEAVSEEVIRRQREVERARAQALQQRSGVWGRVAGYIGGVDQAAPEGGVRFDLLSPAERDQLLRMAGGEGESEVEAVDLPQRVKFEFVLGKMAVGIVDDRWPDEVRRQLLRLSLQDAHWAVDVNFATDHRGQDTTDWRLEVRLGAFRAFHAAKIGLRFRPPELLEQQQQQLGEGVQAPELEGAAAARLLVETQSDRDQHLLSLRFDFAPLEVHLVEGVVERVLEIFRAPEELAGKGLRYEEVVDISKDLVAAHGERARTAAEQVYGQLPEKFRLDVRIASPIVHVPVAGLGSSTFSLGHLQLVTPEPCTSACVCLAIDLTHTTLRTSSSRGEQFNIIEPVRVHLALQYMGLDDEDAVDIQVAVEQASLSLTPQALQTLLATPAALACIMYATETASAPVELCGSGPLDATALKQKAAGFVRDVLGGESWAGQGGDPGGGVAVQLEVPGPSVREKQCRVSLALQLDTLAVLLSDSIAPSARVCLEMAKPGLVMYWQSVPEIMSLTMDRASFEVELLTPRADMWEPLVERFGFGVSVSRTPEGDGDSALHVVLSGHDPLLLNLTPTGIRQARGVLGSFASCADAGAASGEEAACSRRGASGTKYRVVNLCDFPLELELHSRHRSGLVVQVQPTGSLWEPLDDWVLPNFATALVARVAGGASSDPLSLERVGAVGIPESGAVAELLAPSPSHRVLLLATQLRIHNQTDLTMLVRFHDAVQREVLMLDIPETSACDASLLGLHPPAGVVPAPDLGLPLEPGKGPESSTLLLPPNALGAIPAPALARGRACAAKGARTWCSIRPLSSGVAFSSTLELGACQAPYLLSCPGAGGAAYVHLLCEAHSQAAGLTSAAAAEVTTICVRPALTVSSALPIGKLHLSYAAGPGRPGDPAAWQELTVPRLSRVHVYGFPHLLQESGIQVRVRLADDLPWSAAAVLDQGELSDDAGSQGQAQILHLKQTREGAGAGVVVEASSPSELRFSCPTWFVDRSGLGKPLALQLLHNGGPLPSADGITMLPADAFQEPCELLLRSTCTSFGTRSVRMPLSWCALPWKTPCGAFLFCLQTEDVLASDVFGARCQAVTLRPRLVITNSADCEVELCLGEGRIMRLGAGQSLEWHWPALPAPGEPDPPAALLRLRPLGPGSSSRWSGSVLCGDAAAGRAPLLLYEAPARRLPPTPSTSTPVSEEGPPAAYEVWTVEVAPDRGALAVSFRPGSDYLAANRAARSRADVAITPLGHRPAERIAIRPGAEVPFGWCEPFLGEPGGLSRAVDVTVNAVTYRVADVRRSFRRVLQADNLVLSVGLRGGRTVLAVEDCEPPSAAAGCCQQQGLGPGPQPSSGGSTLESAAWLRRIEVKLCHVGVSLVEERPEAQELLYLHLELVRLEWRESASEVQQLKVAVSEVQVDCQLPDRDDAAARHRRSNESLGLPQRERPAVIFANHAAGDRAFLSLLLQRSASSSRDISLPFVQVCLDAMDVSVDDGWLDRVAQFVAQASDSQEPAAAGGVAKLVAAAGTPIVDNYEPPTLPAVIQVDALHISAVHLTIWCLLRLHSARFLPAYLRNVLRVLSLSGKLSLDGAHLALPARSLPPYRGPLPDFLRSLAGEYTTSLLHHAGALLGKSSVLNLPRVPLSIGGTAVSYVTDTIGLAAGEAASLLSQLTFDGDYVARQQQLRARKQIRSLGDGVAEAGISLVQGVEGFLDIVKKPVEGARGRGLGGFLAGVGKGVAGGVVKPISKLGQAISDVGSGIAAQVAPDAPCAKRRRARLRQRPPRLLFSQAGLVREWSALEAEVLRQLGRRLVLGVEEMVPLTSEGSQRLVLLLFPQHLLAAEVRVPAAAAPGAAGDRDRAPMGRDPSDGMAGASTPSSSSRSGPAASPGDFFGAVDETAFRLLMQALKPVNALAHGVQGLERQLQRRRDGGGGAAAADGAGAAARGVRELRFADLRAVRSSEEGALIELEDAGGGTVSLPLFAAPMQQAARAALAAGLRAALAPGGVARWDELRAALRAERRRGGGAGAAPPEPAGRVGERSLEVFEVERRLHSKAPWRTAFLPVDGDLRWRWVDARGYKHPHLKPGLTRKEAASKTLPPCWLDTLFHSTSEWAVCKGPATDEEGWSYGPAFHSSAWDARPGLFDAVRRRRWTRAYA